MENQDNLIIKKKAISKKTILFLLSSIVVVIVVVILTVYLIHKFQAMDTVQTVLKNAVEAVEKSNGENGYPQALPSDVASTDKVKIEGGGSFDGTTYCISGRSNEVKSVVYHISSGDKEPQGDECPGLGDYNNPGIVTGIETTIISANQLGFTWSNATDGVSYTIQCSTDENFEVDVASSMKASTTRNCKNLKDGTKYFIRIRANNPKGAGAWSSILTTNTTSVSTAPGELSLTPSASTRINYSWKPISGAQKYVVEWASDINFTKDLGAASISTTSGTVSGLKPSTQYFFHVKAVTANFDAAHAAFSAIAYTTTPSN